MKIKCPFKALFYLVALASPAWGEDITGHWVTVDDDTGQHKSVVEIYQEDGVYHGKIADLLIDPKNSVCQKCKGDLKNKPLIGMYLFNGLSQADDIFSGSKILDPEKGKFYKVRLWLEGDDLKVRGSLGPFHRTQTWYRQARQVDN